MARRTRRGNSRARAGDGSRAPGAGATCRRACTACAAAGSRKTLLMALGGNAAVTIAKLAGGLLSGSAAMLAETAHSLADTVNQVFLLASIALADCEPTP